MNEKDILTLLLKKSYTKAQIQRRLRILKEFVEHKVYSKTTSTLSQFLKKEKYNESDIEVLKEMPEEIFKIFDKKNTYNTFNRLTSLLQETKPIEVYIPYEFDDKETEKLGLWFRNNVSDEAILEPHTDPALLGGCAVAMDGVYKNYSLRYYIDKYRDKIRKIIEDNVQKQLVS